MRELNRNGERGVSLLSVLVSLGMFGILASTMATQITNGFKAQKKLDISGERTAIKQFFVGAIDCGISFPTRATHSTCSGGTIKNSNGAIILDTNTKNKIGNWHVKAECSPNIGVDIKVALLDKKGTGYSKDPLTGKILDFTHPKSSLFQTSGFLCQSHFAPPPPASGGAISWKILGLSFKNTAYVGVGSDTKTPAYTHRAKGNKVRVSSQTTLKVYGRDAEAEVQYNVRRVSDGKMVVSSKGVHYLWGNTKNDTLGMQSNQDFYFDATPGESYQIWARKICRKSGKRPRCERDSNTISMTTMDLAEN